MARKLAEHGTRQRYNQGCTDGPNGEACAPCRAANSEYSRNHARIKRAEKLGTDTSNVTPIDRAKKPAESTGPGPMEQACLEVTAKLDRAKDRPDLVAAALALARDIDSPMAVAQRANLVARYHDILSDLTKGSERKSRLAAVRQMTRPTSVATG